jgi:hypothetical protein
VANVPALLRTLGLEHDASTSLDEHMHVRASQSRCIGYRARLPVRSSQNVAFALAAGIVSLGPAAICPPLRYVSLAITYLVTLVACYHTLDNTIETRLRKLTVKQL